MTRVRCACVQILVEFSIVCPIKNEIDLIVKTLPSFFALKPSEVILCLDAPILKDVLNAINRVANILGLKHITRIIEVEQNPEYNFQQAYARRKGFHAARNDLILTTDIDLILDHRIRGYLSLINDKVRLIGFNKIGYPHTVMSAVEHLMSTAGYSVFTGLYAFSRSAWLETEDIDHLKKQTTRAEDAHLHHYVSQKYESRFVGGLKNHCLRPRTSRNYQFAQGVNGWTIRRKPLWKMLTRTFLYFRPHLLLGYLQARHNMVRGKISG